jgi:hypothetical protein
MRRPAVLGCLVAPVAFASCLLLLAGCSNFASLGRALFTGTSFADLELHGVARGCVPITGAVIETAGGEDPRLAAIGPLLQLLGTDPLGCVLQVEPIGEMGQPFYALCQGEMSRHCAAIPGNQPVVVTGSPIGPAGLLRATRVARDE